MKLSDAPTTEAEVTIAASAETVWRIISDLQTPALTSPEFQGAQWLDGATEPVVGARFIGHNEHPALGAWQTTSFVIVADAPREFAYAVEDPDNPAALWRYVVTPLRGADGVRLTQIGQIGPGPSGLSYAIERMPEKEDRIIERRLSEHQAAITKNLQQIKKLAEKENGR